MEVSAKRDFDKALAALKPGVQDTLDDYVLRKNGQQMQVWTRPSHAVLPEGLNEMLLDFKDGDLMLDKAGQLWRRDVDEIACEPYAPLASWHKVVNLSDEYYMSQNSKVVNDFAGEVLNRLRAGERHAPCPAIRFGNKTFIRKGRHVVAVPSTDRPVLYSTDKDYSDETARQVFDLWDGIFANRHFEDNLAQLWAEPILSGGDTHVYVWVNAFSNFMLHSLGGGNSTVFELRDIDHYKTALARCLWGYEAFVFPSPAYDFKVLASLASHKPVDCRKGNSGLTLHTIPCVTTVITDDNDGIKNLPKGDSRFRTVKFKPEMPDGCLSDKSVETVYRFMQSHDLDDLLMASCLWWVRHTV